MDQQNYKIKNLNKKCFLLKIIQDERFESDFVFLEVLITEFNNLISSKRSCEQVK